MKRSAVCDGGSNSAVEQTAGSHPLAAAAHRERSAYDGVTQEMGGLTRPHQEQDLARGATGQGTR